MQLCIYFALFVYLVFRSSTSELLFVMFYPAILGEDSFEHNYYIELWVPHYIIFLGLPNHEDHL